MRTRQHREELRAEGPEERREVPDPETAGWRCTKPQGPQEDRRTGRRLQPEWQYRGSRAIAGWLAHGPTTLRHYRGPVQSLPKGRIQPGQKG